MIRFCGFCEMRCTLVIPAEQEEEEDVEEMLELLAQFDHSPQGPHVPFTGENQPD